MILDFSYPSPMGTDRIHITIVPDSYKNAGNMIVTTSTDCVGNTCYGQTWSVEVSNRRDLAKELLKIREGLQSDRTWRSRKVEWNPTY